MTPEQIACFWDKVAIGDGCWEWQAYRYPNGYGGFRSGYAHRAAYELTHGPIPAGLFVCHHCDNPPCVRPDHLFLGTNADNMRDKMQKGRGNTKRRGNTNIPAGRQAGAELAG